VEVTGPGALLDLGFCLDDRLAHLSCDQPRGALPVGAQVARGAAHWLSPFGKARGAPLLESGSHLVDGVVDLSCGERVKAREHFLGRRINGLDGHDGLLLPWLNPCSYLVTTIARTAQDGRGRAL